MNPIKEWLANGRPYLLGVALYAAHGSDQRLMDVFRQGHSDYRQARLEDALRKLTTKADLPKQAPEPVHKAVSVDEAALPETKVPEAGDKFRAQWLPLYMEMNSLRHRLRLAPSDAVRGEWAHRILELERACNKIWQRRDYEIRTGIAMPDESAPTAIVTERNALHRRLTNLRTYITKEQKKPEPKQGKLQDWQQEVNDILKTLGDE